MTIAPYLLAALAAVPTPYQEHHCDEPMSQMDMNFCAALDFEAADAELNRLWPQVIHRAQAADRELDRRHDRRPTSEAVLRDAQRAWIRFRDAHCSYERYEARGGSMEPLLYNGCRAQLTRDRIAQLQPDPL